MIGRQARTNYCIDFYQSRDARIAALSACRDKENPSNAKARLMRISAPPMENPLDQYTVKLEALAALTVVEQQQLEFQALQDIKAEQAQQLQLQQHQQLTLEVVEELIDVEELLQILQVVLAVVEEVDLVQDQLLPLKKQDKLEQLTPVVEVEVVHPALQELINQGVQVDQE